VINLRSATLADLDLLRHWDEQPHVISSDPNDDWNWEVELELDVILAHNGPYGWLGVDRAARGRGPRVHRARRAEAVRRVRRRRPRGDRRLFRRDRPAPRVPARRGLGRPRVRLRAARLPGRVDAPRRDPACPRHGRRDLESAPDQRLLHQLDARSRDRPRLRVHARPDCRLCLPVARRRG